MTKRTGSSEAGSDIFISYAHDDVMIARPLADWLAAEGYNVWWDRRLSAGEIWLETLVWKVYSARRVLVLWSPRAAASKWVEKEGDIAAGLRKLIPLVVEEHPLPKDWQHIQHKLIGSLDGHKTEILRAINLVPSCKRRSTARRQASSEDTAERMPSPRRSVINDIMEVSKLATDRQTLFLQNIKDSFASTLDGAKELAWKKILSETMCDVIFSQISQLDPVDRNSIKAYFTNSIKSLKELHAAIPQHWIDDLNRAVEDESSDLYGTQYLGEDFVGSSSPVSIWVPVNMPGALAISYHTKLVLGDAPPLRIHAGLPDALAIVARARGGWEEVNPPELIVTGDAPSLEMIRADYGRYHVRMSLPPCEQRIIVCNKSKIENVGKAQIPTKLKLSAFSFSNPQLHLTKLFNYIDWKADKNMDRISFNIEPRIAIREILSGDYPNVRYPLWSPHWQFISRVNGGKLLTHTSKGSPANYWYPIFLMASNDFVKKDGGRLRRIEGQMRRSWFALRRSEVERKLVVNALLSDELIMETLLNTCNLDEIKEFFFK